MRMSISSYFDTLLGKYLSLYILPENKVTEVNPFTDVLIKKFPNNSVVHSDESDMSGSSSLHRLKTISDLKKESPDYILLNGMIHYEHDIQALLNKIHEQCVDSTRLIITYYSSLWKPLMRLASFLGVRHKTSELNWISHDDIFNLLDLTEFETVRVENKVLIPVWIPFLSNIVNQYIAPLPFFRLFTMLNILVARPLFENKLNKLPSVSVVVAARNEAGNIEDVVKRVPKMGQDDELIFVEGNSTDNTWETIQEVQKKYYGKKNIVILQQDGKGKGDAVRKGFASAKKEILMILDADMTVPPEDLSKFYNAIVSGKGEFINGSRLVYPMEKRAMRFFNILGNKFFATTFSFVLAQRYKDTLCGTKVLTRKNYQKLSENRHYFGEFDPFGDFDLIFGAARMCLKTIEVPITYRERIYGETNISRWRHGTILLMMLAFAARKIKFL